MNEKDLRKLSRLELLEILFKETKENEALRQELENARSSADGNDLLLTLTESLSNTLKQAKEITAQLDKINKSSLRAPLTPASSPLTVASSEQKNTSTTNDIDKSNLISDLRLYLRILSFYSENETALELFPENMQKEIRSRIRGIVNAKK